MAAKTKFSTKTKIDIFRETGHRCANPSCRKHIYSYDEDSKYTDCLAQACHIYPARNGGPRYDETFSTPNFLSSKENGICLCRDCHSLIDVSPEHFTAAMLLEWKEHAKLNNQPEQYQPMPLVDTRVSGADVRELARYIEAKKKYIRRLEECMGQARSISSFQSYRLDNAMLNVVSHLAGTLSDSGRFEFVDNRIGDEVRLFSSMAAVIRKDMSFEHYVTGGAVVKRDATRKDIFGKDMETIVYLDDLIERFNHLVQVFRELVTLCADLEEKTFTY